MSDQSDTPPLFQGASIGLTNGQVTLHGLVPADIDVEETQEATHHGLRVNDETEFEPYPARMLRDCAKNVALASAKSKLDAFRNGARLLGKAVSEGRLPKTAVVDRLIDIALAHDGFGLKDGQIEGIIGDVLVEVSAERDRKEARTQPKRHLITHRASDLQPEKLVWVWPGRIPEGKLVLLGGPPGLGKSQLTAFMAATISNGDAWPCDEGTAVVGNVIIMSAEDGIEDTIIPRLIAAGADTQRIHIVAAATKPNGMGRKTFSLKTDVDLLEEKAKEIGDVRLIIVDPISAYMGGSDGNGNVETREVLEPLADMANRLRIAVVAVTHLNKGGSGGNQSALNRFAGSIAFVAAARAAFAVIEDFDDESRRLLLQAKNNLGPKCKGLAFRMEQRVIPGEILSSSIFFEDEHVSRSIDEALAASESRGSGSQTSSKQDAVEFLSEVLAHGPLDVLEIEMLARTAGLLDDGKRLRQDKAFRIAREALGVVSAREGFGKGARYVLSLPGTPCAPKSGMCAPNAEGAHMDPQGAHETNADPNAAEEDVTKGGA